MKIGQTTEQTTASNVAADKARTTPATTATGTAAADKASTQVALSNTATSLIGTTDSNADFDTDKVASVTHAIDSGTYKVNAQVIADKLISNARELLTKATQ